MMEASQTPSAEELRAAQERQTQAGQGDQSQAPVEGSAPAAGPAATAEAPVSEGEANQRAAQSEDPGEPPAVDQAPVAHEAQEAIIGDPGQRAEQQPLQAEGTPTNVNQPVRTSAPPPSAQSGVPLPEDRAAGVEPGEAPASPEAAVAGSEAPPREEEAENPEANQAPPVENQPRAAHE